MNVDMIRTVKIPEHTKYVNISVEYTGDWTEVTISVDIGTFTDRYKGAILSKGIYPHDCADVVKRFEDNVLAFCHRFEMVVRQLIKSKADVVEEMRLFSKENGYACSDFMYEIESIERNISLHNQLKNVFLNILKEDKPFLEAIRNINKEDEK